MKKMLNALFKSPESELRQVRANCVQEANAKYNNTWKENSNLVSFKVDVISRLSTLETMFKNHLEHHRFVSWALISVCIGLLVCLTTVLVKFL